MNNIRCLVRIYANKDYNIYSSINTHDLSGKYDDIIIIRLNLNIRRRRMKISV